MNQEDKIWNSYFWHLNDKLLFGISYSISKVHTSEILDFEFGYKRNINIDLKKKLES